MVWGRARNVRAPITKKHTTGIEMKLPRNPCLLVLVMLIVQAAVMADARVEATQLHVAPQGNDAWSGLLAAPNAAGTDGPFATVTGARDAIRIGRAKALAGPIVVNVHGGNYFISEPIVFGPEDSGSAAAPIVYRAVLGEEAVVHGGRVINGWRQEGAFWVADIPEVRNGASSFSQFWVNGERRTPARTPNAGNPAGDFPAGDDLFYTVGPVMDKKAGAGRDAKRDAVLLQAWRPSGLG